MVLQDDQGLLFASFAEVATMTPEYRERWRVVLGDGTVAFRTTPPPAGPWVLHGKSWVAPRHMVKTETGWRDPAGFQYGPGELPEPPAVGEEARWPPTVPELPCPPERVISLLGYERKCYWHTDDGDIHWNLPAVRAAVAHPGLVKVGKGVFLNRARLRRILKVNRTVSPYTFVMDSGDRYELDGASMKSVAERLGLANLTNLEPHRPGLKRYDLRDYPYEITNAKRERLRADFRDRKHQMANILWQTLRWRQDGVAHPYQDELRGLFYYLWPGLIRAGWAHRGRSDKDDCWDELREITRQLVSDYRLFTFLEIGYRDVNAHQRIIGKLRPEVILLAEKGSLDTWTFQLAAEFGISCHITRGNPSLLDTEYLARALGEVGQGAVHVIAYVDFDPGGWQIADTLVKQLTEYGLPHVRPAHFMIGPEDFTAEELELNALPCPMGNPGAATKARQWFKRSGGINGKLMTINVNSLQSYDRVRACLVRALADVPT